MSKQKNPTWKAYESLTKFIYETLGHKDGVKVVGYGSNNKIPGKSGVSHQIDVLTSHSDGVNTYLTAIECKYWNKKIGKETAMKLCAIMEDTDIEKGIIVSFKGFTKDGITFAKHMNIELVQLRDISSNDLESIKKNIAFGELEARFAVTLHRPTVLKAFFVTSENQSFEFDHQNTYSTMVQLPDGNTISLSQYVDAFKKELQERKQINQIIIKEYDVPKGNLFIQSPEKQVEIAGLIFNGVLKELDMSSIKKFTMVDKVSHIMQSISENKLFRISESGIIEEHKE